MKPISDLAIHCEAKKHAYRQTQDGVVVSFVLHPQEVPEELAVAPLGARYVLALVAIGDDETPQEASKPSAQRPQPVLDKPQAGAKRSWKDLQPSQQAGIRCEEPSFYAFLHEEHSSELKESYVEAATDGANAAECTRLICGIASRAELNTNQKARVIWHQLNDQYEAWMRVGA